jgi:predicted nucleic acid-binding protein
MALIALDTSVVIALLNPLDAHHASARAALLDHADDDLRMPAHVLAESLVHPARAGREREAIALIGALEIAVDPVDEQVAVAAARLRARHAAALRMPDALVLAYGDVRKAATILTADSRWPRWSERARVLEQ